MYDYAPHFASWVESVAKTDFGKFEKVKKVCIAQSIRETGRGKTAISKDHNNLLGVKYHDFLSDLANEYKYYTDSEPKQPDGSQGYAMFCSFHSQLNCAVAWQRWFEHWEHYKDALTKLDSPEEFIKEIAHHYATDPAYEQAILSLLPEATELLNSYSNPNEEGGEIEKLEIRLDKVEKEVLYLKQEIQKLKNQEYFVYKFVNVKKEFNLNVRKSPDASSEIVTTLPYKFKVACYELENGWYHVKGMKDNIKFDGWASASYLVDELPIEKYKIMLNSGHAGTSGASGKNKEVKEDVENKATVDKIKEHLSKHEEFEVSIVNQNDNAIGLEGVGKATKDYDLAIAIHYNASDGVEHGSEVLVPPKASDKIKQFAQKLVNQMCADNKLTNRGIKEKSLSVFTGFNSVENNPCVFVLSEGHFIDDETDIQVVREKSFLNAKSHYQAILNWFNVV